MAADGLGLMEQGVVLETEDIQFIYTKAGETKVQMMAEATADARRRAEEIAARGALHPGIARARMGVVQINPPLFHGHERTEGNNDTSSLEKTITATVTAEFTLK